MFLYLNLTDFIQAFVKDQWSMLTQFFNFICSYIDDVFSLNISLFNDVIHVDHI